VDVLGTKATGHHEVDLHGAELPSAADRVLQVVLDLRAVERALARQFLPFDTTGAERRAQRAFGLVPGGVVAKTRLRTQRDLDLDVSETEVRIDLQRLLMEGRDFGFDLVFGAE